MYLPCRKQGTYNDAILDAVLDLLSEMIQCKACEILINSTWQLGTNWVQQKESHMTNQQLTEHMQAMCEIMVDALPKPLK